MDFKKLEKATNLLKKIKSIDKEIIEIDKMALSILNNETKIEFDLKVENTSENKEDQPRVFVGNISSDSDNSFQELRSAMFGNMRQSGLFGGLDGLKKNHNTLNKKISDTIALQILGVLLCEKNNERQKLLKEIEAFYIA